MNSEMGSMEQKTRKVMTSDPLQHGHIACIDSSTWLTALNLSVVIDVGLL